MKSVYPALCVIAWKQDFKFVLTRYGVRLDGISLIIRVFRSTDRSRGVALDSHLSSLELNEDSIHRRPQLALYFRRAFLPIQ